MKNRLSALLLLVFLLAAAFSLAAAEEPAVTAETAEPVLLEDGVYLAVFGSDSSMFHVNEAWEGKAVLTVENGAMTLHLVMPSKNILQLFAGLAADAGAEGAVPIDPTVEEVTYKDGFKETVFAFDIPVPVIGEEFDCALIGKKGKWYDHKVIVTDPVPYTAG